MGQLFGTDGIRGVAGRPPLDQVTITKVGLHWARQLKGQRARPEVVIARDTRASGIWIEETLAQSLEKQGIVAARAGILSTPGVAYVTRNFKLDGGIMISASHNPYQDNGIKIFSREGTKLSDEEELALERLILDENGPMPAIDSVYDGHSQLCDLRFFHRPYFESYVNFLLQSAKTPVNLRGLSIVVDCANGAVFKLAPKVFSAWGAKVRVIHDKPDGFNINLLCGSTHPEAAQRAVVEDGADLGISFDGDADRVIFTDHKGRTTDGDHILYLFAKHLQLSRPAIVGTVMSNLGLELALHRINLQLRRAPVGDRYVLEEMITHGINIGGEQSGHIILSDYSIAGDGLLTALKVLQIMSDQRKSLAELVVDMQKLPQTLINVRVKTKVPFDNYPAIQAQLDRCQADLGDQSRILLRYSGTEPLARIMIEGQDQALIEAEARKIADTIREQLG
ncbi:MAG: phosphoglucosamine mutase [Acidobacteria bacterium]|nr:phosphoglucosamine mutase [Acidobacteriota bacterium]MBI3656519.1 phosphoglucosamine mutase [Acidobacteriota bacterium]